MASRERGIKGPCESPLFGFGEDQPRGTDGHQAWPVSGTGWLVSVGVHSPSPPLTTVAA